MGGVLWCGGLCVVWGLSSLLLVAGTNRKWFWLLVVGLRELTGVAVGCCWIAGTNRSLLFG